ncbi:MAG: TetR/AcrR family transcriptional regulator [Proteobacteria bacterium]|nr:TetR/AcrR family transcriptional regulator [Pseudomonadota bacterium]
MANQRSRKDEILDAASKLFARLGFKKTTLDEVAGEVGIVKSALYRYFSNKEDLFNAVIDRLANEHMEAIEKAVKGASGTEEKLRALLIAGHGAAVARTRDVAMPLEVWRELKPLVDECTEGYKRSAIDSTRRIIEDGVRRDEFVCDDPQLVAVLMHAFAQNQMELAHRGELDERQGERNLNLVVDVLMDGLRKRK